MIEESNIWIKLKEFIIEIEKRAIQTAKNKGTSVNTIGESKFSFGESYRNNILEHLILPLHRIDDFIGCSKEEIEKLETTFNITLPEFYVQFLQEFGRTSGFFSDWLYNIDAIYNLNKDKEKIFDIEQEIDTQSIFIFASPQDAFYYFDLNDTLKNPLVYLYHYDYGFINKEEQLNFKDLIAKSLNLSRFKSLGLIKDDVEFSYPF